MQIYGEKVNNVASGDFETVLMGLNPENLSQAAHMFRNQIYSDVPWAVVREYICNAIDEHDKYQISRPVEVTLTEESFKVRDFAFGLPKDKVLGVFFQYLASTKQGEEHGGFGIGAKAALAWSDIFYVTSFHNGAKTLYAGGLEDRGGAYPDGVVRVLTSEETDESGIEVEVPLKKGDKVLFEESIKRFARFSKGQILFNGELIGGTLPDGYLSFGKFIAKRYSNGKVSVRLGEIVYPTGQTCHVARSYWDLIICADSVNACSVPPSREQIKLDAKSQKFINDGIAEFKKRLVDEIQKSFQNVEGNLFKEWAYVQEHGYEFHPDFSGLKTKTSAIFGGAVISCYDNYSSAYAKIKTAYESDVMNSAGALVVFHYGLPKTKRQYIAESKGREKVYFVQVADRSKAEGILHNLSFPKENVKFAEDFVFPKTVRSQCSKNYEVYILKKDRQIKRIDIRELDNEMPVMLSRFGNVERGLPIDWYNFEYVIVPASLKSFVKGWPFANHLAEKARQDFIESVKNNKKEYLKKALLQYDSIRKYLSFNETRLSSTVSDEEYERFVDTQTGVKNEILNKASRLSVRANDRLQKNLLFKVLNATSGKLSPEEINIIKEKLK